MTIWQEVSGPVTDNESSELLSHYVDVYGEGLSTPREVNQVLNSIRFRYPGLRDYVFYPDLCLLQLISVVNPLFAGWVEHYLTVWSVVENRDGIAHEDEQKALIAELAEALKKFGASRAASVWELRAWMPEYPGLNMTISGCLKLFPFRILNATARNAGSAAVSTGAITFHILHPRTLCLMKISAAL